MSAQPPPPPGPIWGFHVHQSADEGPPEQWPISVALQDATREWLASYGIAADVEAATKPGYGPHFGHAWELRVETVKRDEITVKFGAAVLFHALNHGSKLAGWCHPTLHDMTRPPQDTIRAEASHHKFHVVVLGRQPLDLNMNFFRYPPLDPKGELVDTRTPNECSPEEVAALVAQGRPSLPAIVDPKDQVAGFELVLDSTGSAEPDAATRLAAGLAQYVPSITAPIAAESKTQVVAVSAQRGERTFDDFAKCFGDALTWLMLNRLPLPFVEWPDYDVVPLARVEGVVKLKDAALEDAIGVDNLRFRVGYAG